MKFQNQRKTGLITGRKKDVRAQECVQGRKEDQEDLSSIPLLWWVLIRGGLHMEGGLRRCFALEIWNRILDEVLRQHFIIQVKSPRRSDSNSALSTVLESVNRKLPGF